MLEKKGNSDSDERMDLVDRFQEIFPEASLANLTADREFVASEWLAYLLIEPTMPFRFRIRQSDRISDGKNRLKATVIFAHLQPGH